MPCRGVYFALSEAERDAVLAAENDDVLAEILEDIEERWDQDWLQETDKAWDAIHRCLTDGTLQGREPRERALCVLGGRDLYEGDEYLAIYISPEQVADVARAIAGIDHAFYKSRERCVAECPLRRVQRAGLPNALHELG